MVRDNIVPQSEVAIVVCATKRFTHVPYRCVFADNQVDAAAVPPYNIDALIRYLKHKEWPLPGAPVGTSRHLGRIAEWVGAVVNYNQVGGRRV